LDNVDVRNLAIAEILRGISEQQQLLYEAAERNSTAHPRTNVIIEEAHEFLSAKRVDRMPTLRDQLTRIAKRGRKRYLGLTFVTQSPFDRSRIPVRAAHTRCQRSDRTHGYELSQRERFDQALCETWAVDRDHRASSQSTISLYALYQYFS
jgi:hypothetical protein